VPAYAGVLSALGMLVTAPGRQLSQSVLRLLNDIDQAEIERYFEQLKQRGLESLQRESVDAGAVNASLSLDLRYKGQSNSLNVDWSDPQTCTDAFHRLHEARYGHRLDIAVELVNVRVSLTAQGLDIRLPEIDSDKTKLSGNENNSPPVINRAHMPVGQKLAGPLIIVESVATTWVAENWSCQREANGNLLLKRQ